MTPTEIAAIAPFFIVRDLPASLTFFRDQLRFDVTCQVPETAPFFAIVQRGVAMLILKNVGAPPLPNSHRHPDARWDAYLCVPDPDALAAEFASRGVTFSTALADTHDGLRGFELTDPDGYVLFFGRPH
jgi:catechol 2,3-dioxygenase-like lactoylglutathione lyase family enzyme